MLSPYPSLYCPQPWVRTCTKYSPLTPLSLLPTALGQDLYQVLSPYPSLYCPHPWVRTCTKYSPLTLLSLLSIALGQDLYQVLSPNTYVYKEEFISVIKKTVQSQVHQVHQRYNTTSSYNRSLSLLCFGVPSFRSEDQHLYYVVF